jgi:predicted chitinase
MNKDKFFELVRPMFTKLHQAAVDNFNKVFDTYPKDVPIMWMAYGMATAFHETAQTMQPIVEYGGKEYFKKYDTGTKIGSALGNTRPGDGYRYRGRGFVQLTGRRNYTLAAGKVGFNLIDEPDLALDFAVARKIMREGMLSGWFTSRKLADYGDGINAYDYKNARKIINGLDCADKIAGYARNFEKALKAAGLK